LLRRIVQASSYLLSLLALAACSAADGDGPPRFPPEGHLAQALDPSQEITTDPAAYPVPPPPFEDPAYFPCQDCHSEREPDLTVRELEDDHTDIKIQHGHRKRWCFDCHNPADRDYLRLASGELVPFTESYRLCGQCHGDKYRDWRMGVHGRRKGMWNGKKEYLLCAHCHNPHSPKFKPIEPLPPPTPPADIKPRKD